VVLKQIREFTVLEFPPDVQLDKDARMLISSLLRRKESDRLGSKDVVGDYKAIKEHSWFSEVRSSSPQLYDIRLASWDGGGSSSGLGITTRIPHVGPGGVVNSRLAFGSSSAMLQFDSKPPR